MNPFVELTDLVSLFPSDQPLFARVEMVAPSDVPQPYCQLLVHDEHMTETMEAFYGGPVAVRVLDEHHRGDDYGRRIVLTKRGSDRVVQFGIVRIDLSLLSESVRDRILSRQTPLGRILAQSKTLRHIRLGAVLRVTCGAALADWLQSEPESVTYGRLAIIRCDGRPAVRLLEICAPVDERTERKE